ncbi:MAG: phosphoribosyltransferase [Elusimicrobia bacterium]|nr:phosphoribosyltransferase [Elusimicrobiota bacterium]
MFDDRQDAGRRLARALEQLRGSPEAVVVAVPFGGLPVAEVLAAHLRLPMESLICAKLRHSTDPELAVGAMAESGVVHLNAVPSSERLRGADLERELVRAREEIEERRLLLHGGRSFPNLGGRTVLLVDDGMITGATMLAAAKALRAHTPARLIAAVPAAARAAARELGAQTDHLVVLESPEDFQTLDCHYRSWSRVELMEAVICLERCRRGQAGKPRPAAGAL